LPRRGRGAHLKFILLLAAVVVFLTPTVSISATLQAEAVASWDEYLGAVSAKTKAAREGDDVFLWADQQPDRLLRLQRGEVVVSQIAAADLPDIPHVMIHDWVGAVFIPNVTLADVFAVERDYKRYPDWYGPTITQASLLARDGDVDHFSIRYVRKVLFVTGVLEAEYRSHYFEVSKTRWYSLSGSTRIQEIEEYGLPGEHKTPPDHGNGYVWRVYGVSKYEERDNGVYIERENIALSRRIPASLQWMAAPVVRRLARELLTRSLQQTREALVRKSGTREF
jgi:hypothetical protein